MALKDTSPEGSTPVPDPTKLTTEAVAQLKEQLIELFGVRFSQVEKEIDRITRDLEKRPDDVRREIEPHFCRL